MLSCTSKKKNHVQGEPSPEGKAALCEAQELHWLQKFLIHVIGSWGQQLN